MAKKFTYLVWDKQYYKIGESDNPEKRLKELKTANPKVELICYGSEFSESELHESFSHKKVGGEWFNLNKRDVDLIKKLVNGVYLTNDEYVTFEKIQQYADNYKRMCNYTFGFGRHKGKKLAYFDTPEKRQYLTRCLLKLDDKQHYWTKRHIRLFLSRCGQVKPKKNKQRKLITKEEWFRRYAKRQKERMYHNLP